MADDPYAAIAKPLPKRAQTASDADPYAAIAKPLNQVPAAHPAPISADLTTNTINPKTGKGYGLYEMWGPNGDKHMVPYNKVADAAKAGLRVKQTERERYAGDVNEEYMAYRREHPIVSAKYAPATEQTPKETLPDAVTAGLPEALDAPGKRAVDTEREKFMAATEPVPGAHVTNVAKSAGRVLFGISDMPIQAWEGLKDTFSGDPEISSRGWDTLDSLVSLPKQGYDLIHDLHQQWQKDKSMAAESGAGDVLGMWLTHKVMEKAPDVVEKTGKAITSPKEAARGLLRSAAGISPEETGKFVEKVGAENQAEIEAAKAKNAIKLAGQIEGTLKAAHEQTGRELEYQQSLRTKAEEIRLRDESEAAKERAAREKIVADHEASAEKARADAESATTDAQKKYFEEKAKHATDAAKTEGENARLMDEHTQAVGEARKAQSDINGADVQHGKSLQDLEKRVHKEASEKYKPLEEKLSKSEVDPEKWDITDNSKKSLFGKIDGMVDPSLGEPPLVTKLKKLMLDKVNEGTLLNYSDLDSFRKSINEEIRSDPAYRGNRIYREILEPAILNEMERIAEDHGLLEQFKDARKSWRDYATMFRDPGSPFPAVLRKLNAETGESGGVLNAVKGRPDAIARLAKFKPSEGATGAELSERLQDSIKNVRKSKAKWAFGEWNIADPTAPKLAKVTPFKEETPEPVAPEVKPLPAPKPLQLAPGSPEERAAQQIKLPERPPYPGTPKWTEPQIRKLGAADLSAENVAKYEKAITRMRTRFTWIGAALPWYRMVGNLVKLRLADAAIDAIGASVATAGTVLGVRKVFSLLERPEIREWVAKPSADEITKLNQLPAEQRETIANGFRNLTAAAVKRGYKVSPLITAYIAAQGATRKADTQTGNTESTEQMMHEIEQMQNESAGAQP